MVREFVKFINFRFDPLTVDGEHGISLDNVVELGIDAGDTCVDVVLEELTKRGPKVGSSGDIAEHQIKNISGYPRVDLLDDSEVILTQRGSAWRGTESAMTWSRRLHWPRRTLKRWHQ
jgi:hypothetical protein